MTKADLKVGDIVKTQAGKYYVILPNQMNKEGLALYSSEFQGCFSYLTRYNDNLERIDKSEENATIVAVYKGSEPCYRGSDFTFDFIRHILKGDKNGLQRIENNLNFEWDWVRPEPVLEVTMADIEQRFGCKVKIVKKEEQ